MKEMKREDFHPSDQKTIEENLQKFLRSFTEIVLSYVFLFSVEETVNNTVKKKGRAKNVATNSKPFFRI